MSMILINDPYLNGFKLRTNPAMTVPGEPYEVVRTWRERLCSRPWRPLQRTRTVIPQVPSQEVIQVYDTLHMHPETARALREQLLGKRG